MILAKYCSVQSLVVVVQGGMPDLASLDPDLQRSLARHPRIHTEDPQFWPKLRSDAIQYEIFTYMSTS